MTYLSNNYSGVAARMYHSPAVSSLPLYTLQTLETKLEYTNQISLPAAARAEESSSQQQSYATHKQEHYFMPHPQEQFSPEPFLHPQRPVCQWIGDIADVQPFVEDIFEKITGDRLPHDTVIHIVSSEELLQRHASLGGWVAPGLQGFSLNKHGFGISEIFVKQDDLDKLLLTLGHEIGHVLSFSLSDKLAEECKAFAFELAWMEAIVEHNVADLALAINCNAMLPAENGLHNVAWQWVQRWKALGMSGREIFRQLCRNQLKPGEVDV